MDNLCIIPARGGSKRIPRKNIKDFLGKPILAYSIETALNTGLFDEVMVSTDDEEIAEIAKKYGATVPFLRSAKNADDFAPLPDVINEVLDCYDKKYKYVCCILPTAPLLKSSTLTEGLELLKNSEFDTIRPVVKFGFPIQRAFMLTSDSALQWFTPEHAKSRSQDLEEAYHDAGQFYWMKGEIGLRSDKKGAIVVDEVDVQDIDTMQDWKMAELKYKLANFPVDGEISE